MCVCVCVCVCVCAYVRVLNVSRAHSCAHTHICVHRAAKTTPHSCLASRFALTCQQVLGLLAISNLQGDAWRVISAYTLKHTTIHCNTMQHIATYCNTLQHTTTYCNTLQYTAIHCNTLQYTAIHCDTLQYTKPKNE